MTLASRSPILDAILMALCLIVTAADAHAQVVRGSTSRGTTAIVGATIITMDGDRVVNDATVLMRDGVIIEVGPSTRVRVPRGATTIDGRGKFVIPGLVDMHSHLYADEAMPDSIAPTELGVMLAMGVTTARMMIGTPLHHQLRRDVGAGRIAGPQLWIASPEFSGDQHPHGLKVATPDEARAAVRLAADSSYDFIKVTTNITPEVYDAIVAEAAARNIRVVGHVDPRVGAMRAIEAKQQIEHLDAFIEFVLADSAPSRESLSDVGVYRTARWTSIDHIDNAKIDALAAAVARNGIAVTPTNAFFVGWFGERPDITVAQTRADWAFIPPPVRAPWMRTWVAMRRNPPTPERLARYIAWRHRMVKSIADAGGLIMAGSDAPGGLMNYGFGLHYELAALVNDGLTPMQALAAGTVNPARYLGVSDTQGMVRAGHRADLLLLDADPRADIANTLRLSSVISGGRVYDAATREAMLNAGRAAAVSPPR